MSVYLQDVCQGVAQVVVAVAENHCKLILEGAASTDENKKADMLKLVTLVLVGRAFKCSVI